MSESKSESKDDFAEAKGGEAKGGEAKGGGGTIAVKVQNSNKIVLFEGSLPTSTTLDDIVAHLPTCPEGHAYSIFEGAVKTPMSTKLGDMTDEPSILLNASYKAVAERK
mmetsp:Transcript_59699/g.135089  ORF Transcript_59699/g.135089 Transcript_59699/m.135089 type:complete len:109 (-) Transcript_59699:205-531(-)